MSDRNATTSGTVAWPPGAQLKEGHRNSAALPITRRRAIAAASLVALSPTVRSQAPIRIGQILPLSGPMAVVGQAKREGCEAYFNAINKAGGIHGVQVQLFSYDDGYVPDRTVAGLRELAAQQVLSIVGLLGAPTSAAAGPVAAELRLPVVGISDSSGQFKSNFNRYMFPLRASAIEECAVMAQYLRTVGISRAAIVSVELPVGKALHVAMKGGLQKEGIAVPAEHVLKADGSNAADIAKALRRSDDAAVLLAMHLPPVVPLLGACAKERAQKQFFTSSAVDPIQAYALLDDRASWLVGTTVMPAPYSQRHVVSKEYLAALRGLMGNAAKPSFAGLEGYVEAKVLGRALNLARGNGRDDVVTALESLTEFDTGGLVVRYGKDVRAGSRFVDLSMVSQSGRVVR